MRFYVVKNQYNLEKNEENIYLVEDKWNDWFIEADKQLYNEKKKLKDR